MLNSKLKILKLNVNIFFKNIIYLNNYFLTIFFLKTSMFFYGTVILDLFGYNNITYKKKYFIYKLIDDFNILLYISNIYFSNNFFILNKQQSIKKNNFLNYSCARLFSNLSWLEREVSEFLNISFFGRLDGRNLLLLLGFWVEN